jgi:hypothetical protein
VRTFRFGGVGSGVHPVPWSSLTSGRRPRSRRFRFGRRRPSPRSTGVPGVGNRQAIALAVGWCAEAAVGLPSADLVAVVATGAASAVVALALAEPAPIWRLRR